MERVHVHVSPIEAEGPYPDIVLTLHHGNEVFPEEGCITLEMNLEMWAGALLDYANEHEPDTILSYDASPDTKIVRREDGSHVMLWLAFEKHEDGSYTPYWYSVDLDFEDFVRQVRDALVMLASDPVRNQMRGHAHERAIAGLGALLGENEPPPPLTQARRSHEDPIASTGSKLLKVRLSTLPSEDGPPPPVIYTIHQHYRPKAPGPSKLLLAVDWDTLAADTNAASGSSILMYIVFDSDNKVFPDNAMRSDTTELLLMVTRLFYCWTLSDECQVFKVGRSSLVLRRVHALHQHDAKFLWWGPASDVPPYVRRDGAGGSDIRRMAADDTVNAHYNLPNVDVLDFTRQVLDAAHTLLRLLDARGSANQYMRNARHMLPQLERIVALVQDNTP